MRCTSCGKEIDESVQLCKNCGQLNRYFIAKDKPVKIPPKKESQWLAIIAIIFSALGMILGLILGIVGVLSYKQEKGKNRCIFAIVLCAFTMVIYYCLYLFIFEKISHLL